MSKQIGVMGSGWLGSPLAVSLIKKGYVVRGTTTSENKLAQLGQLGIQPFLVQLQEDRIVGDMAAFLKGLAILVVNVPPGLRKGNQGNYVAKMQHLLDAVNKAGVQKLIFVSSTSVYGKQAGFITEDSPAAPQTSSGHQLLAAEQLFSQAPNVETTIIRFGGLIAADRHPVYRLSGRELTNGDDPVNLIHRNDCIFMIQTIIQNGYWNQLFNGVYPHFPTKRVYYTAEAKKKGIPPPVYVNSATKSLKKKVLFKNFLVKGWVFTTPISS